MFAREVEPMRNKGTTASTNGQAKGTRSGKSPPVRYAVVGLGYIAQVAVLPAFAHAKNSKLTALVSSDPLKLRRLGRKYGVEHLYSDEEYDECLASGEVDAVYIALPNNLHCEYTVRAANAGVHILCEKPMAVTVEECERMIEAARSRNVHLMIAYRLHFEETNLKAVELAQSGKLGSLRTFNSLFTMSVKEGNIRLKRELGGGTLYDIGIYCINAARYIFRAEPQQVVAFTANNGEPRFSEVEEMASVMMRFSDERLATFVTSFGAADTAIYQVVGTKGDLRVDQAYEIAEPMRQELMIKGKKTVKQFAKRDQFAPELMYFSDCVRTGKPPEPSGQEGLADVRVIEALYESASRGQPVHLQPFDREKRPDSKMAIKAPPIQKPKLVHAESPSMAGT